MANLSLLFAKQFYELFLYLTRSRRLSQINRACGSKGSANLQLMKDLILVSKCWRSFSNLDVKLERFGINLSYPQAFMFCLFYISRKTEHDSYKANTKSNRWNGVMWVHFIKTVATGNAANCQQNHHRIF